MRWVYLATALSALGEVGMGVGVVNGIWDDSSHGRGRRGGLGARQ
jgi:hypothetical protein